VLQSGGARVHKHGAPPAGAAAREVAQQPRQQLRALRGPPQRTQQRRGGRGGGRLDGRGAGRHRAQRQRRRDVQQLVGGEHLRRPLVAGLSALMGSIGRV